MKQNWLRNKKFREARSGTTREKNFAVHQVVLSLPCGLQQKCRSASLNPLPIAPLFTAGFALHIGISAMQRFHAMHTHEAL